MTYELVLVNGQRWYWHTEDEITPEDEAVVLRAPVLEVTAQPNPGAISLEDPWHIRGEYVVAWKKRS